MFTSAFAPERAGAASAAPLPCHNGNISTPQAYKSVPTYYRRRKVEVENNIREFARKIGLKYGANFENAEEVARTAQAHLAEFTITLGAAGRFERGALSRAWDKFNRKFLLSEEGRALFGDWVRVFECHKSGALHAHIIIECKRDLRRFVGGVALPFKLRHYRGYMAVDGVSCAQWVVNLRERMRGGLLGRFGLGSRHTFQPIYKGISEAAKYVSKYVAKSVTERPAGVKGVRIVAYSKGFERMLKVIGYDKSKKISYFSRKYQCVKWRYKTFLTFDVLSAANRVRRLKLRKLAHKIGAPNLEFFQENLGSRWAWNTFSAVNAIAFTNAELKRLTPWEKLAAFRHDSCAARPLLIQTEKRGIVELSAFNAKECGAFNPIGFRQGKTFINLRSENRRNRFFKYNAIAKLVNELRPLVSNEPLSIKWRWQTVCAAYFARTDAFEIGDWPRVHRLTRIIQRFKNISEHIRKQPSFFTNEKQK